MESIQFGGRRVAGFGVGVANPFPQDAYVKKSELLVRPPGSGKIAAFVGGAVTAVVAGSAATALAGEGSGPVERLQRSWRTLAATAVTGGIVGVMAA